MPVILHHVYTSHHISKGLLQGLPGYSHHSPSYMLHRFVPFQSFGGRNSDLFGLYQFVDFDASTGRPYFRLNYSNKHAQMRVGVMVGALGVMLPFGLLVVLALFCLDELPATEEPRDQWKVWCWCAVFIAALMATGAAVGLTVGSVSTRRSSSSLFSSTSSSLILHLAFCKNSPSRTRDRGSCTSWTRT